MFIISGLQQFGLHRDMQNKVDRGPVQKMGCNKLLKNYQMGCKLFKKIENGLYVVCHRFGG